MSDKPLNEEHNAPPNATPTGDEEDMICKFVSAKISNGCNPFKLCGDLEELRKIDGVLKEKNEGKNDYTILFIKALIGSETGLILQEPQYFNNAIDVIGQENWNKIMYEVVTTCRVSTLSTKEKIANARKSVDDNNLWKTMVEGCLKAGFMPDGDCMIWFKNSFEPYDVWTGLVEEAIRTHNIQVDFAKRASIEEAKRRVGGLIWRVYVEQEIRQRTPNFDIGSHSSMLAAYQNYAKLGLWGENLWNAFVEAKEADLTNISPEIFFDFSKIVASGDKEECRCKLFISSSDKCKGIDLDEFLSNIKALNSTLREHARQHITQALLVKYYEGKKLIRCPRHRTRLSQNIRGFVPCEVLRKIPEQSWITQGLRYENKQ
ncbi:hypothetical protein CC80DRAFT_556518 [Byssothecium circinans]|uniref:Uncharacterized protein n=1 Tax=Byssothecium circinans TaxID=147558 RepID=A0A6A5TBV5_9PLEO|nr:hypothetical protein CC80DRAFT_556518 [Byssothecium circinans]